MPKSIRYAGDTPTAPVVAGSSPSAPTYASNSPTTPTYYSQGVQDDVGGGPYGGIIPVPCVGVYHDVYVDLYSCT